MTTSNENNKPASEIDEFLKQAKNELHQRQQLFIAQKTYIDALKLVQTAEGSSSEARDARRQLEKAKISLENLVQLIDDTSFITPS